jgi:Tol biopolymer transport system component
VNTGRSNPAAFSGPHDWSPDDSRILVTIGLSSDQCRLGWLSVKDGTVTDLKATRGEYLDRATISPAGVFIAYAARRAGAVSDRDVHIARSDGTGASLLIGGPDNDAPVAWTPDGAGLIYQGNRSGNDGLWVVRVSGGKAAGEPVAVPGVGRIDAHGLTRSGALLYATGGQNAELWLATVDLAAGKTLDRKMIGAPGGSAAYSMGSYSPDGALMTYDVRVGNRTGFAIARADGGEPRLFTPAIRPGSSTPPTWSGDSRTVFRDGTFEPSMRAIFRVDVQTGAMEPVFPPFKTDSRAPGDQPSTMIGVSADGKTAYYQKNNRDTRKSSLWSRDVGTGQEKERFRTDSPAGIWSCGLSPDGKRLLFVLNPPEPAPRELRTLSLNDGTTTTVCKLEGPVMSAAWSQEARHVVFGQRKTDAAGASSWELWVVEAGGGQPRSLGIVHPIIRGLAVHPDGKHIAYVTATPPNQEEWLLENFLPTAKPSAMKK